MANWSDPQSGATSFATATGARTEAFDAGLRRYMLSVYNYMFSGILLTGIVAMGFAWGGATSAWPRRSCSAAPASLKYDHHVRAARLSCSA